LNGVACIDEPKELPNGDVENVEAFFVVAAGADGAYHEHI